MSSTEPGLFETQNKLDKTGFDPTIAREDTSYNQQVKSVYGAQSNQSSNERTSTDNSTPPPPGTPSKETMERLRAAVSKSPNNQTLTSKPMVATKNPEIKDKPRFGIGSLINRMAGTGQAELTQNDIPKAQKENGEDNYNAENEELGSNKEKIEVPAFLRRQAN
jgi:cell division protein FtsZ